MVPDLICTALSSTCVQRLRALGVNVFQGPFATLETMQKRPCRGQFMTRAKYRSDPRVDDYIKSLPSWLREVYLWLLVIADAPSDQVQRALEGRTTQRHEDASFRHTGARELLGAVLDVVGRASVDRTSIVSITRPNLLRSSTRRTDVCRHQCHRIGNFESSRLLVVLVAKRNDIPTPIQPALLHVCPNRRTREASQCSAPRWK